MVLIGSSTAPAARYAVRELPVGLVPLVRFGVAGLCSAPGRGARGGDLARMVREDGWRLLAAAFCCVPVNQTFFLNAARLTSTAHVALIYAACPLVVLLLAAALGQERLVPGRLVGRGGERAGRRGDRARRPLAGGGVGPPAARRPGATCCSVGAVVSWGAYLTVEQAADRPARGLDRAGGNVPGRRGARPAGRRWRRCPAGRRSRRRRRRPGWGLAYLTLVATVLAWRSRTWR